MVPRALQTLPPILLEFVKRQVPLVTNRELARRLPSIFAPRDAQRLVSSDTWHPSREAHEQLAGFALHLMGRAARSVRADACQHQAEILAEAPGRSQCSFGDLLLGAFVPSRSRGWELTSERGKPGLVATRAGALLTLAIAGTRARAMVQVRRRPGEIRWAL